ncbi:MAG: hypothetical protein ACD_62C00363G0015 [uncultured bacterium]|nr:MAG: hypothetical protein ACD_62C00363G0015 [uncultured bacterium]HLD44000.1 hypothetical protein [bacterium]
MKTQIIPIIIFALLITTRPVVAKPPSVCPCATSAQLWELAKGRSIASQTEPDFRKMGQLAADGVYFAELCLKKNPKAAGCYYYRAINRGLELKTRTSGIKVRLTKMVQDLQKTIQLDERYDEGGAYNALGYIFLKTPALSHFGPELQRDLTKAEHYAQKALKISPNNPYHLTLAGEIAIKRQAFDQALAYFRKANSELAKITKPSELDEQLKKDLKKFIKKINNR